MIIALVRHPMSRPSKYDGFRVSSPYAMPIKCPRDVALTREYVNITCPHCNVKFGETTVEAILKMKSTHCAKHLSECTVYKLEAKGALVVATQNKDEIAELRAEMADMKRENLEMKQKMNGQQEEIKGLQDKTGLYDSVLEAVMPSLALPLTAPEEKAKITLREAAIKDITTLVPSKPCDVISKEIHVAIIEHKNAMIAVEKERREELREVHMQALERYKHELEMRDSELAKAQKAAQEANQIAECNRRHVNQLQKERDALDAKYKAMLKGHEQAVRGHGKHGPFQLSKLQQGQKRALAGVAMEAQTAAAVAFEREFAAKRACH